LFSKEEEEARRLQASGGRAQPDSSTVAITPPSLVCPKNSTCSYFNVVSKHSTFATTNITSSSIASNLSTFFLPLLQMKHLLQKSLKYDMFSFLNLKISYGVSLRMGQISHL